MNIILCWKETTGMFNAGSKAKNDILQIALNNGFDYISLYTVGKPITKRFVEMITACFRLFVVSDKNSIVLVQYPFGWKARQLVFPLLQIIRKICKFELCCVIHDLEALRNDEQSGELRLVDARKQINELRFFDSLICHNNSMHQLIRQTGYKGKIRVLGPFDYLYDGAMPIHRWSGKYEVVVAGNLSKEKSAYLYQLPQLSNVEFRLFGVGFDKYGQENVKYCGSFLPEELMEHLDGNFGLVWDGTSAETCAGAYGEYLKWNNPHKLSMCIVAGLPIIIWDQAALASYVTENDIGVTVSSLRDISKLDVTEEHYQKMIENIRVIREELVHGKNLLKALELE